MYHGNNNRSVNVTESCLVQFEKLLHQTIAFDVENAYF